MSEVNDLSLNIFYGEKPVVRTAPAAEQEQQRYGDAAALHRTRKRPRTYPTAVPRLPSFDEQKTAASSSTPSSTPSSSSRNGKRGYLKPAPLRELPKLKPRQQSVLPASSLQPPASAMSDPRLFSPASFPSFSSLPLSPRLVSAVTNKLKLTVPTSIQCQCVPPLVLTGRDALIRSQTGSGKSLAYLLPLLQHLTAASSLSSPITRRSGPLALILLPTRELCLQTFGVLSSLLLSFHWLVASPLMGGENRQHEKQRIRRGVNVIVATPGRLIDHLDNTQGLQLAGVRWLVMDEADRLLDLGFEKEIAQIIARLDQDKKAAGEEKEGGAGGEGRRRGAEGAEGKDGGAEEETADGSGERDDREGSGEAVASGVAGPAVARLRRRPREGGSRGRTAAGGGRAAGHA